MLPLLLKSNTIPSHLSLKKKKKGEKKRILQLLNRQHEVDTKVPKLVKDNLLYTLNLPTGLPPSPSSNPAMEVDRGKMSQRWSYGDLY